MKKVLLFLIIFLIPTLAFASDCKQSSKNSAFVLYDRKSIKIKSGMKIDETGKKIIINRIIVE